MLGSVLEDYPKAVEILLILRQCILIRMRGILILLIASKALGTASRGCFVDIIDTRGNCTREVGGFTGSRDVDVGHNPHSCPVSLDSPDYDAF
ncbi:hypothetical protein ACOSP7_024325 [Xanthoceras sorbifolium]